MAAFAPGNNVLGSEYKYLYDGVDKKRLPPEFFTPVPFFLANKAGYGISLVPHPVEY